MSDPEEQPGDRLIELEAPEYLNPEQNFFDQPPFAMTVQQLAEFAQKDPKDIRVFILSTINSVFKPGGNTNDWKEAEMADSRALVFRARTGNLNNVKGFSKDLSRSLITQLADELKDYPFWIQYIYSEFNREEYDTQGNLKPNVKIIEPSKTYANWVADKLKRNGNMKNLVASGIEDVFPQDFAKESPLSASITENRKTSNKRWRILKASNLVPGK